MLNFFKKEKNIIIDSIELNTLLILKNVNINGNKSLFYYNNKRKEFFRDCIFNCIAYNAGILTLDALKRYHTFKVKILGEHYLKLIRHIPGSMEFNEKELKSIGIVFHKSKEKIRITKNSLITITFTKKYLQPFDGALKNKQSNTTIKVPLKVCLESCKNCNLGYRGTNLLLWFLSFYRFPNNPVLNSSIETMIKELEIDMKHGKNKSIKRFQVLLNYLHKINVIDTPTVPILSGSKNFKYPLTYHGDFLTLNIHKQISKSLKPPSFLDKIKLDRTDLDLIEF